MYNATIKVLEKINTNGYEAYVVGGYPRDIYLGRKSSDVDICTNATPKDIKDIFKNVILPTNEYGSVTVIYNKVRFEITTYRKDLKYINNRIPSKVRYTDDLFEDLRRRDFTINTLCMNSNGEIIDVLGIKEDLDSRIIKTVGDAKNKISEDSLRILRAIRFSTILDFELDKDLKKAIKKYGYLLQKLSYYRKKEELDKIFTSKNVCRGVRLLLKYGLDKELEIENLKDVKSANNLIGVWTVLKVEDKYPFTSNEKSLIKNINTVLDKNNLDPYNLYKYGLYVNSVAGEIKGIDLKEISSRYQNLPIRSRKELDITAQDIIDMMGKEPGSYINEILGDIEYNVLYRKLKNNKEDICKYIEKKYK